MKVRALILAAAGLAGCTPTLDWRDVRPEGSGAVALFPCKPSTEARNLVLAGNSVRMTLVVCKAGGDTYALAFADTGDPAKVVPALEALKDAVGKNLAAEPAVLGPLKVPGMTPQPLAQRLRVMGKGPDGAATLQEAGLFSRGTWVYRATVMGERLDREAVDTFFDSLKLPV